MPPLIYTPDEVLDFGLKLFGFDDTRIGRTKRATLIVDFKSYFGAQPVVCAAVWEDLQTTEVAEAGIDVTVHKGMVSLETFLRALHFLKRYPTEGERKGPSKNDKKTIRKYAWYFLERIQALKPTKIKWPDEWKTNFIISVDGVHCKFHEPKHPTLSLDTSFSSHKFGKKAGLSYELALSLFEPKLVWTAGPFPAGGLTAYVRLAFTPIIDQILSGMSEYVGQRPGAAENQNVFSPRPS